MRELIEVTLRPAGAGDMDEVLAMSRSLYQEDGAKALDEAASRRALEELLQDPTRGEAWVAAASHGLVGYLIVTFGFSLEYKGIDAFIDELFVGKAFRRRGLGHRLIEQAKKICVARGVKALHLEVEQSKMNAQSLYRREGFENTNRYLLTKWL